MPAYRVEGVLTRGRFGIVYRARHKELGTPARLTVLVSGEHGSSDELAELRDRVGAARQFGDDHLVHVTEVWTQPSDPTRPIESLWVAYQHVEGFTLEEKISDGPVFWGIYELLASQGNRSRVRWRSAPERTREDPSCLICPTSLPVFFPPSPRK